jgi:hypothetical protein
LLIYSRSFIYLIAVKKLSCREIQKAKKPSKIGCLIQMIAIAEISLHPSNYIGGGPRDQGVELPVGVSGKLAPGTCGIKIRLGTVTFDF